MNEHTHACAAFQIDYNAGHYAVVSKDSANFLQEIYIIWKSKWSCKRVHKETSYKLNTYLETGLATGGLADCTEAPKSPVELHLFEFVKLDTVRTGVLVCEILRLGSASRNEFGVLPEGVTEPEGCLKIPVWLLGVGEGLVGTGDTLLLLNDSLCTLCPLCALWLLWLLWLLCWECRLPVDW